MSSSHRTCVMVDAARALKVKLHARLGSPAYPHSVRRPSLSHAPALSAAR